MYTLYAFRDNKSGVLSNFFVTAEPFAKVKQNVSVSLLQLSMNEKTNPFILFSKDYDLVAVQSFADDMEIHSTYENTVNVDTLLAASRSAFEMRKDQTSPTDVQENSLE